MFRPQRDKHQRETYGPTLTIKTTDSLLRRISQLSTIAKEQRFSYLVTDMSGLEHAWAVSYIYSPDKYYKSESYLCVSAKEIWVRVDMKDHWSHDQYETERIPLAEIGPIELVPQQERRLPSSIRRSWIKPYAMRINALREAHAIYESLVEATFDMEQGIPSEKLAMFD